MKQTTTNTGAVTVTITENGKQLFSSEERIVLIVGGNKGVMSADCKTYELLEFAVRVQEQFLKHIIPQLLQHCNSAITEEMLFAEIVKMAKSEVAE